MKKLTKQEISDKIWDILGTEEESKTNYYLNTVLSTKLKKLVNFCCALQKKKGQKLKDKLKL